MAPLQFAPASQPRRRILLLAAGLLFLVVAAFVVLGMPLSQQEAVRTTTLELVRQFEARELLKFTELMAGSVDVSTNGTKETLSRQQIVDRCLEFQIRLHKNGQKLDIRPARIGVRLIDGDNAEVDFLFHWSLTNPMYPNMPLTSERENDGGRPERALLTFIRGGDSWILTAAQLILQQEP